jgi:hypothetical protein
VQSDDADGTPQVESVQGHAVALVLPTITHVLGAIVRANSMGQQVAERLDPNGIQTYTTTLFPPGKIAALNTEDQETLTAILHAMNTDGHNTASNGLNHLPYVIDGTITTDVSFDYSTTTRNKEKQRAVVHQSMGQILAHRVTDVTEQFYDSVVELTLGGVQNQMAATYVFTNLRGKSDSYCGATISELRSNSYALVPLLKDSAAFRKQLTDISTFTASRAMIPPTRVELQPLYESNFESSMKSLKSLQVQLRQKALDRNAKKADNSELVELTFHFTPKMLLLNPDFIEESTTAILRRSVIGDVDVYSMPGNTTFQGGKNAMHIVVVSVGCVA